jgi:hypothetical protein
VCDCNSRFVVIVNYFVCVIINTTGYFMIVKKDWIVCVCNYFAYVIATRSYLWLQHDCVCMVKATWLFGYLWLQAWVVCDSNIRFFVIAKYFVCVIANTAGYFMIAKKRPEQCVFETILRAWLQPEVICDCNMTLSMWLKATWLFSYL